MIFCGAPAISWALVFTAVQPGHMPKEAFECFADQQSKISLALPEFSCILSLLKRGSAPPEEDKLRWRHIPATSAAVPARYRSSTSRTACASHAADRERSHTSRSKRAGPIRTRNGWSRTRSVRLPSSGISSRSFATIATMLVGRRL